MANRQGPEAVRCLASETLLDDHGSDPTQGINRALLETRFEQYSWSGGYEFEASPLELGHHLRKLPGIECPHFLLVSDSFWIYILE